jgi:hypothetical protein
MLCACRLNNRCEAQQLHKKRNVKAITNNPFSYMHSHFRYLSEHPKRIPACRDKICKKKLWSVEERWLPRYCILLEEING